MLNDTKIDNFLATVVKKYLKWIKSVTKRKGKCYKKSVVSDEKNVLETKPGKYHDHVDKEIIGCMANRMPNKCRSLLAPFDCYECSICE